MALFRSRAFSAGNAAIFLTFASLFTGVFFFAQFLQTASATGRSAPGLRLLPWTATFMTVAPIAGALADRIGERPLMVDRPGAAGGRAGLARARSPSPAWRTRRCSRRSSWPASGVSMAIPAAQNSVIGSVAPEALGKAAGVNSMMRELGGVFGIAVTVAVFAGAGGYASAEAFVDGFAPAIGVAAGLAALGAVVRARAAGPAYVPSRSRSSSRRPDPRLEPEAGAPDVPIGRPPRAAHPATAAGPRRSTPSCAAGREEQIERGRRVVPRARARRRSAAASWSARPHRPVWVPYVEVRRIDEMTDRARRLGASVLLEPREGRNGWRSVVSTVQGGEIAFWQPKRGRGR